MLAPPDAHRIRTKPNERLREGMVMSRGSLQRYLQCLITDSLFRNSRMVLPVDVSDSQILWRLVSEAGLSPPSTKGLPLEFQHLFQSWLRPLRYECACSLGLAGVAARLGFYFLNHVVPFNSRTNLGAKSPHRRFWLGIYCIHQLLHPRRDHILIHL
jgi:hypothetical protein